MCFSIVILLVGCKKQPEVERIIEDSVEVVINQIEHQSRRLKNLWENNRLIT